jgi:hypothetical protein
MLPSHKRQIPCGFSLVLPWVGCPTGAQIHGGRSDIAVGPGTSVPQSRARSYFKVLGEKQPQVFFPLAPSESSLRQTLLSISTTGGRENMETTRLTGKLRLQKVK